MNLKEALESHREDFGLVLEVNYRQERGFVFDLTANNHELKQIDVSNVKLFNNYIFSTLENNNYNFGIGKYLEKRTIYDHSKVFSGQERRIVHLGIDLWIQEGSKILVPISGKVHSFNNNIGIGDYGPTIILEHILEGITFYTLYGHLSLASLENIEVGMEFEKGSTLGHVGNFPHNGNWPAHLHFQIISDMLGRSGDYFGVCAISDKERFSTLCPDPNLILNINYLN